MARKNGLPEKDSSNLDNILSNNLGVFRTSFSSGPPADITPLKIILIPDFRPVKVRLCNYSQEQRQFLEEFSPILYAMEWRMQI